MTVCSTNHSLLPIFPSLGPSLCQCVVHCVAKLSIDVTAPMRRWPCTTRRSLSTNLFHDRALFMRDERSSTSAPVCGESGGRILQYRRHRRRWRQGVRACASRSPATKLSLPPFLSLSVPLSISSFLSIPDQSLSRSRSIYAGRTLQHRRIGLQRFGAPGTSWRIETMLSSATLMFLTAKHTRPAAH